MTAELRQTLNDCQYAANEPKEALMEIENELRSCGLNARADKLSKIIASLEHWQNI